MKKILAIFLLFLFIVQIFPSFSNQLLENNNNNKANNRVMSKTTAGSTFVSTWTTAYPNVYSTVPTEIALPLVSTGSYNFVVNWGDGNSNTITSYNQAAKSHIYATTGNYTVSITGMISGWSFGSQGSTGYPNSITGISSWGTLALGNDGGYFSGATHLVLSANDSPDLTGTTTLNNAFRNCKSLGNSGNMSGWNVSQITDMSSMFEGATDFNQNITTWNVSSVINMQSMFYQDYAFDQPLNSWNVSKVASMDAMFYDATSLDQPFNAWNVSQVTDMIQMFYNVNLSTANYDSLLNAWSKLPLQNNVVFNAGNSTYTSASSSARQRLISVFSWTITDGGKASGFISTWNTAYTFGDFNNPTSNDHQIQLPLVSSGTYDFYANWGDGVTDHITSWNQAQVTHTYSNIGVYTLIITGTINGWSFNAQGDAPKITRISQWGPLALGDGGYYFYGANSLNLTATDAPDLNGTTTLTHAFDDCEMLGSTGNMSKWNVSQITNMSYMFTGDYTFNQSISDWNVSSVTNMYYMLLNTNDFNQPLNSWNVSHVTNFGYTLYGNYAFNQSLDHWNVSSATTMVHMFADDYAFNQPLDNWDVSKVTDMTYMFSSDSAFNQPLNNWNVSQVTSMYGMFGGASALDQSFDTWNVSQVTDMSNMFYSVTLSPTNYGNLLIAWSKLPLQYNVTFDASNSYYNSNATNARQYILDTFYWNINDHGIATTPSAPRNLMIKVSSDQAFLNWTVPSTNGGFNINRYNIYQSTTSGSNYSLIGLSTVLNYTVTGLTNGVTYYFIVSALSDAGVGANSTEVSGTPLGVPTAPQNLLAQQQDQKIVLTWTTPSSDGGSAITNYTIYRSSVSGSNYVFLGNSTTMTFTDTSVTSGVTYYYVISANNALGQSNFSSEVSTSIIISITSPSSSTTPLNSSNSTNTGKSSPFSLIGILAGLGILILIERRKK